jgi:hypothetical protein
MRATDVLARQQAMQGRQGTPLLEPGGEPPLAVGSCGAAPRSVFGGDQRQPASGVEEDAGGIWRSRAAGEDESYFVPYQSTTEPSSAS